MSDWNKMDREVYGKSEVMQELEKKVAHSAISMQEKIEKIAQAAKDVPGDLAAINREAPQAAQNLGEVNDAVEKMYNADDEETEDVAKEEEVEEIMEDLVECLQKLSEVIADEGDTTLAYKVERLMSDIRDGFVRDED